MDLKQLGQRVLAVSTRSVINSLLWLPGLLILMLGWLGTHERANMTVIWGFLGILSFFAVAIVVAFAYFARREPSRLQSEQHVENVMQLQIAQGKSGTIALPSEAPTANPRVRRQKPSQEGGE